MLRLEIHACAQPLFSQDQKRGGGGSEAKKSNSRVIGILRRGWLERKPWKQEAVLPSAWRSLVRRPGGVIQSGQAVRGSNKSVQESRSETALIILR